MNKPRIIQLPKFIDARGNLSVIEEFKDIPFKIKRTYWIYDVPGGEARGGHAYRETTVVHKSAFIGKGATLCPGAFVMYNCYIGPNAHIGKCSLIMANCSICHDTYIDDLCHCSVGSIMTGYSKLEYCSDLAVGATIIAYKVIGKYSMVAANAVATHDIPEGEIWAGTPAKFLKNMSHE